MASTEDKLAALQVLTRSRALWNRSRLDLESDEILAQVIDRGSLEDWRAIFLLLSGTDAEAVRLRERVHLICFTVPTGRPYFWLAVLAGLGHEVNWSAAPRVDPGWADI